MNFMLNILIFLFCFLAPLTAAISRNFRGKFHTAVTSSSTPSTTATTTITDIFEEENYIYACGDDEFRETKCSCQISVLNCNSNGLINLNIHVLQENFTVKSADFKNNGIQILKNKQILPGREFHVQTLDFQFNTISKIDDGTFDKFHNLQILNLSNNNLTFIDENVLTEKLGKSLQELNLNRNQLQRLNSMTFQFLTKLQTLGLSDNPAIMPFFHIDVFSKSLSNLKKLDLSFCNITTLEDDVFENLINLEDLIIHKNPFSIIPAAINSLPSLRTLDASHTNIKVLTRNTFTFNAKMESLGLIDSRNLISVEECAFCNFPNLKKITFWYCTNLSHFHENAFGSITNGNRYSNLKEFDIEATNISTLPQNLFDWEAADKLYLSTNGFNCDCSMAWLLNDLGTPNSIYSKKLRKYVQSNQDKCTSPKEFKGQRLAKVSGKVCQSVISHHDPRKEAPSNNLAKFHWMILGGILIALAVIIYFNQNKIIKLFYHHRKTFAGVGEEGDEERLEEYF